MFSDRYFMSTTDDAGVKYEKLSLEFAKLRHELPAARDALEAEKRRTKHLEDEVSLRDITIRKITSENESYKFRNDQLVKRVEALQENLDKTTATFANAKAKKKHKEANLRLFGSPQLEAASSSDGTVPRADAHLILEQELERKLAETATLHSQLYDLERQHETVVTEFSVIVQKLEADNEKLRKRLENVSSGGNNGVTSEGEDELVHEAAALDSDEADPRYVFAAAILDEVQLIATQWSHLFAALDGRSTVYPCDATLQSVPEEIHLFGIEAKLISDEFEALAESAASAKVALQAGSRTVPMNEIFEKVVSKLRNTVATVKSDVLPLLKYCRRKEGDVSWCSAHLDQLNGQHETLFSQTFSLLLSLLSETKRQALAKPGFVASALVDLQKLSLRYRDVVSKKVFVENHLPMASRKLKEYNAAMEKSAHQVSQAFARLHGLIVDSVAVKSLLVLLLGPIVVTEGGESDEKGANRTTMKPKMSMVERQASVIEDCNVRLADIFAQLAQAKEEVDSLRAQLSTAENELALKTTMSESLTVQLATANKAIEALRWSKEDLAALRLKLPPNREFDDFRVVEYFFLEELQKAVEQAEHANAKVAKYQHDLDELTMVVQEMDGEFNEFKNSKESSDEECRRLKEDLELTKASYEEQLKVMSEHLASLVKKAEEFEGNSSLNGNTTPTASGTVSASSSTKSLTLNLKKIVGK